MLCNLGFYNNFFNRFPKGNRACHGVSILLRRMCINAAINAKRHMCIERYRLTITITRDLFLVGIFHSCTDGNHSDNITANDVKDNINNDLDSNGVTLNKFCKKHEIKIFNGSNIDTSK